MNLSFICTFFEEEHFHAEDHVFWLILQVFLQVVFQHMAAGGQQPGIIQMIFSSDEATAACLANIFIEEDLLWVRSFLHCSFLIPLFACFTVGFIQAIPLVACLPCPFPSLFPSVARQATFPVAVCTSPWVSLHQDFLQLDSSLLHYFHLLA